MIKSARRRVALSASTAVVAAGLLVPLSCVPAVGRPTVGQVLTPVGVDRAHRTVAGPLGGQNAATYPPVVDSRDRRVFVATGITHGNETDLYAFSKRLHTLKTWHLKAIAGLVLAPNNRVLLVARYDGPHLVIDRINTRTLRHTATYRYPEYTLESNLVWAGGYIYAAISSGTFGPPIATLSAKHLQRNWRRLQPYTPDPVREGAVLGVSGPGHWLVVSAPPIEAFKILAHGRLRYASASYENDDEDGARTISFSPDGARVLLCNDDCDTYSLPDLRSPTHTYQNSNFYLGGTFTDHGRSVVGLDDNTDIVTSSSNVNSDVHPSPDAHDNLRALNGPVDLVNGTESYFTESKDVMYPNGDNAFFTYLVAVPRSK